MLRNTLMAGVMLAALSTHGYAWDTKPSPPSILILENDAGMVIQVPDMTAKECGVAVALLTPTQISCPTCLTAGSPFVLSYPSITPKPITSKLTTAKCVVAAQDQK